MNYWDHVDSQDTLPHFSSMSCGVLEFLVWHESLIESQQATLHSLPLLWGYDGNEGQCRIAQFSISLRHALEIMTCSLFQQRVIDCLTMCHVLFCTDWLTTTRYSPMKRQEKIVAVRKYCIFINMYMEYHKVMNQGSSHGNSWNPPWSVNTKTD